LQSGALRTKLHFALPVGENRCSGSAVFSAVGVAMAEESVKLRLNLLLKLAGDVRRDSVKPVAFSNHRQP